MLRNMLFGDGHGCQRSEDMVREKNSLRSGKGQGMSLWARLCLGKRSGKREILRVHIYIYT